MTDFQDLVSQLVKEHKRVVEELMEAPKKYTEETLDQAVNRAVQEYKTQHQMQMQVIEELKRKVNSLTAQVFSDGLIIEDQKKEIELLHQWNQNQASLILEQDRERKY